MKKTNYVSSFMGKFFFVLCFFVTLGITTASAQALKQNGEAEVILKQEMASLGDKLPTLVAGSAQYKYTVAKLTAVRSISNFISTGSTTETAIKGVFELGNGKVETEEGGFADRVEATQARTELELLLKN